MLVAKYIRRLIWKIQGYALAGGVLILLLEAALKLLGEVTQGVYPFLALCRLLVYKIPGLCNILFPFSVTVGFLLCGSWLRQSRELIALYSLGMSPKGFRSLLLCSQLPIGLIALINSLCIQPMAARLEKQFIVKHTASVVPFAHVVGKIQRLPQKEGLVLIGKGCDKSFAEVFILWQPSYSEGPLFLLADEAIWSETDAYATSQFVQLKRMHWYKLDSSGIPQLSGFAKTSSVSIPKPPALALKEGAETVNSWELFQKFGTPESRIEACLRLTVPLSVYLFALLSLPLVQKTRTGRWYALQTTSLFLSLLLYMVLKPIASSLSLQHKYTLNYTFGILHGIYGLVGIRIAYPACRKVRDFQYYS